MQKGFTLVEGLLIILVIAVVGFGGFYAINQSNDNSEGKETSTSDDLTSDDQTSNDLESSDDNVAPGNNNTQEQSRSDGWVKFVPDGKEYSIRLADGWTFYHQNDECDCLLTKTSKFSDGTPAEVETVQGGRDGSGGLFIAVDDRDRSSERFSQAEIIDSSFETKGLTGTKYKVGSGGSGIGAGIVSFDYYFENDGKFVFVSYGDQNNTNSNLSLVEEMIRTIE